ncbi:MAG: hypothetical protein ABGY96_29085 [bacterium]|nr:hypothetical protein [Gammaproteobacteria bacterium]HIL95209.1 hypothetical protein [Pseudomonadales bacterium]
MTARALEANGIATVVIGSALDIVEHCGVPRYLHNDIPLGNPLGHPYNTDEQLDTVRQALSLLSSSAEPVVRKTAMKWHNGESWRGNYLKVDDSNREALKLAGVENRRRRREQIEKGEKR